jgi:hypothetical protein
MRQMPPLAVCGYLQHVVSKNAMVAGEAGIDVPPAAVPRWAFVPDAARVDAIDAGLRQRLAASLDYIEEIAGAPGVQGAGALKSVRERLNAAPVSPWTFGLYARLVAELSRGDGAEAASAIADLADAARRPAQEGIVILRSRGVPGPWWDHFEVLLDTDKDRPFNPGPPDFGAAKACETELQAALALLQRADSTWHGELGVLLRMLVLGAPPSRGPGERFNGASTFFLWGGALLNANVRRSPIRMLDVLVHESSHVLLFGVAANEPLTLNAADHRFASPLREDKRPIDGIFHACFVTTRVHLAMTRLLASGELDGEATATALERRRDNALAARGSLEILDRHAEPSKLGSTILSTMRDYWTDAEAT